MPSQESRGILFVLTEPSANFSILKSSNLPIEAGRDTQDSACPLSSVGGLIKPILKFESDTSMGFRNPASD